MHSHACLDLYSYHSTIFKWSPTSFQSCHFPFSSQAIEKLNCNSRSYHPLSFIQTWVYLDFFAYRWCWLNKPANIWQRAIIILYVSAQKILRTNTRNNALRKIVVKYISRLYTSIFLISCVGPTIWLNAIKLLLQLLWILWLIIFKQMST